MKYTVLLKVPCDAAFIKVIRDTFHSFAMVYEFSEAKIRDGKICISELVSNIIKHALEKEQITVRFLQNNDDTVMEFEYKDSDFDAEKIKKPDIHALESGGYGLHIVKRITEEIVYENTGADMLLRIRLKKQ